MLYFKSLWNNHYFRSFWSYWVTKFKNIMVYSNYINSWHFTSINDKKILRFQILTVVSMKFVWHVILFLIIKRLRTDWIFITVQDTLELIQTFIEVSCESELCSAINLRETRVQLQTELLNGQNSIRVVEVVVELFQRTPNTLTPVAQTTGSKTYSVTPMLRTEPSTTFIHPEVRI
jgi:hypothetical protein